MKCKNCDVEMDKVLRPIVFSPSPPRRTVWRCPDCGATRPRLPDEGELDDKPRVYTATGKLRIEDWF